MLQKLCIFSDNFPYIHKYDDNDDDDDDDDDDNDELLLWYGWPTKGI